MFRFFVFSVLNSVNFFVDVISVLTEAYC